MLRYWCRLLMSAIQRVWSCSSKHAWRCCPHPPPSGHIFAVTQLILTLAFMTKIQCPYAFIHVGSENITIQLYSPMMVYSQDPHEQTNADCIIKCYVQEKVIQNAYNQLGNDLIIIMKGERGVLYAAATTSSGV